MRTRSSRRGKKDGRVAVSSWSGLRKTSRICFLMFSGKSAWVGASSVLVCREVFWRTTGLEALVSRMMAGTGREVPQMSTSVTGKVGCDCRSAHQYPLPLKPKQLHRRTSRMSRRMSSMWLGARFSPSNGSESARVTPSKTRID